MIKREELVEVGKFQKTHALKGELNMISDVDTEYFLDGNPLFVSLEGIYVPFFAETVRPKGSTSYLVKLQGIDTEKEASGFVNKELFILKKDAEEWLEEEIEDINYLEGYKVEEAETGKYIGEIERVDDSTANVLFIVKGPSDEEIYLPVNDEFVVEIDDENHIVRYSFPEGLLDINN